MKLIGRTALVTGGAVRIGRAVCLELARAGCRVAVHYHRSEAEAATLVAELGGLGVEAWSVRADLASSTECGGLIRQVLDCAGGTLDLLVNNASLFTRETLEASSPESIAREFAINLFAPMHLTRELAKALAPDRVTPACVINLLDRRIESYEGGCVPYLLSKKALAEFTKVAAVDLAPRLRVNGVAPGAILPPPGAGRNYLQDRAGPIPLNYRAEPGDIAVAVRYLAETEALTGQILFVDGGQNLLGTAGTVPRMGKL